MTTTAAPKGACRPSGDRPRSSSGQAGEPGALAHYNLVRMQPSTAMTPLMKAALVNRSWVVRELLAA